MILLLSWSLSEKTLAEFQHRVTINSTYNPEVWEIKTEQLERFLNIISMIVLLDIINPRGYFRIVFFPKTKISFLRNEGLNKFA